jgi:hypothetical protein
LCTTAHCAAGEEFCKLSKKSHFGMNLKGNFVLSVVLDIQNAPHAKTFEITGEK